VCGVTLLTAPVPHTRFSLLALTAAEKTLGHVLDGDDVSASPFTPKGAASLAGPPALAMSVGMSELLGSSC